MSDAPNSDVALTVSKNGVTVPVVVRPRGRVNGLSGVREGALLISVAAAPVDGAANAAVIAVLAESLKVPRSSVSIIRGHKSRQKTVALGGVTVEDVRERIVGVV